MTVALVDVVVVAWVSMAVIVPVDLFRFRHCVNERGELPGTYALHRIIEWKMTTYQ